MFKIGDKVVIKTKNIYPISDYGSIGIIESIGEEMATIKFEKMTGVLYNGLKQPDTYNIEIDHITSLALLNYDLFGKAIV